jgi:predicted kinase
MTNDETNPFRILTVVICTGIPASGKSTWALELLKKYPGKYKRTNRDSLRAMLDGDHRNWDNEKFVVKLRDIIVERALRDKFDVIVDDTNFKDGNWQDICAIAKKIGNVRVMEKNFPIDLKTALERNDKREKRVPPEVIENFYKKYVVNKHREDRDEFFPLTSLTVSEYPESNPDKIDAIIVDIDGTVALHWGRSPYDMSKVLEDTPNVPICSLVKLLSKTYSIIFASGREDCGRADTELWLKAQELTYAELFMRKTGDNRKDVIIKREIYERDIQKRFNIKFVLDDRAQTVEGWRDRKSVV